MNRLLAFETFLVAMLAMPLMTPAAEMKDLDGVWRIKTSFGTRAVISMLRLTVTDDSVSGVLLRRPGQQSELKQVEYKDGEISFTTSTSRRNGRGFTVTYTGQLNEGKLAGKIRFVRGSETREWEWVGEKSDESVLDFKDTAPPVEADIELTVETYDVWRDHILPAEKELAWKQIPWEVTFKDGILAANRANKPLLFWTMNGHPLGCT